MGYIIDIYRFILKTAFCGYKKYNHKIKTIWVSLNMSKAQAIRTGFNIMIVHFYISRKFSVWLRTGFNPWDINRFQSQTGNKVTTKHALTLQIVVTYIIYYS